LRSPDGNRTATCQNSQLNMSSVRDNKMQSAG
jgi:hypothetical protein